MRIRMIKEYGSQNTEFCHDGKCADVVGKSKSNEVLYVIYDGDRQENSKIISSVICVYDKFEVLNT